MTADGVAYTLDNTWENAERRLSQLEAVYDPGTIARLTALGVDTGWQCLELGAGHGSIARWLSDRVGPNGSVTAVDLEPHFLEADPRPNIEIVRRDIVAEGIPGDGYDLIHARALLMHLPDREKVIAEAAYRLRAGGVMLLEEGDFYSYGASESELFAEMWDRCAKVAAKTGGDWYWARHLPACLSAIGLAGIRADVDGQIFPGASAWTELAGLSWEQLTPLLVADGCSSDLITAAIAELNDPSRWFPACVLIAVSGRRV